MSAGRNKKREGALATPSDARRLDPWRAGARVAEADRERDLAGHGVRGHVPQVVRHQDGAGQGAHP